MWPPHAPTSSHRRPIGRVLGAGFDRRQLSLRQARVRRLRPAGRLTCPRPPRAEERNQRAKLRPLPVPVGRCRTLPRACMSSSFLMRPPARRARHTYTQRPATVYNPTYTQTGGPPLRRLIAAIANHEPTRPSTLTPGPAPHTSRHGPSSLSLRPSLLYRARRTRTAHSSTSSAARRIGRVSEGEPLPTRGADGLICMQKAYDRPTPS